jgi:hypothetical protein
MLDEEPLFTPLTIENIAENAQKSKVGSCLRLDE